MRYLIKYIISNRRKAHRQRKETVRWTTVLKTGNESLVVGLLSCLKRAREMTFHLFRHRKQPAERHAKHFMLLRGAKNQISLKYR